jgi:hypothetical protein
VNQPINHRPFGAEAAALEARFGLRVAASLSRQADALPHDVVERLRFAREQALAKAKPRLQASRVGLSGGAGSMALAGSSGDSWWWRLASLVPLLLLVVGLMWVHESHRTEEIVAVADVDAALLADAVPPTAYVDPGFAEFLKSPRDIQPN